MAVFSRRSIQRMLTENRAFLIEGQSRAHVRRLEGLPSEALAAEWEIAVLNVLSKCGSVSHEPEFDGGRPDVVFSSRDTGLPLFLADITSVSDVALHIENPVEALADAIWATAKEHGIDGKCVTFHVHGSGSFSRGGVNPRVHLPAVSRLGPDVIQKHVLPFLLEARNQPRRAFKREVREPTIELDLTYDPARARGYSYGSIAYTPINDYRDNSLYKAILRKDEKLGLFSFEGPKGIFLCDGGCHVLGLDSCGPNFMAGHIVQYALEEASHSSFVILTRVLGYASHRTPTARSECRMSVEFFAKREEADNLQNVYEALQDMPTLFPQPEAAGGNALARLKHARARNDRLAVGSRSGMEVSFGNQNLTITISTVTLLELLAGKITQEQFFDAFWFSDDEFRGKGINFFANALRDGKTIRSAKVTLAADELDDDLITFELQGPDPAVSRFQA